MRTVIYGCEDIFASYKTEDGTRKAITVDSDGTQVNVVFPENEVQDRIFDYGDWMDLSLYEEN